MLLRTSLCSVAPISADQALAGCRAGATTSYDGVSIRKGDFVDVRIGIIQTHRELSIDLPDEITQDDILATIEAELAKPDGLLWLTDGHGAKVGLPAALIAYVE